MVFLTVVSLTTALRPAWLESRKADTKAEGALDTAVLAPLEDLAKAKGFVRGE